MSIHDRIDVDESSKWFELIKIRNCIGVSLSLPSCYCTGTGSISVYFFVKVRANIVNIENTKGDRARTWSNKNFGRRKLSRKSIAHLQFWNILFDNIWMSKLQKSLIMCYLIRRYGQDRDNSIPCHNYWKSY